MQIPRSKKMNVRQLLKIRRTGTQQSLWKHFCSYPSPSTKTASHVAATQSLFDYTHAITREIPKSFPQHSLKMDSSKQIVLSSAIEQLSKYVDILKRCGLVVITIPADEHYPDCVFVEDSALVIGRKACLTKPGHPSRRGEVTLLWPNMPCISSFFFLFGKIRLDSFGA